MSLTVTAASSLARLRRGSAGAARGSRFGGAPSRAPGRARGSSLRKSLLGAPSHGAAPRGGAGRLLSLLGAVVLGALVLSACSSSSSSSSSSTKAASTKSTGLDAFAASHFTTKLSGICPNPLVVQTNWLPEPDHATLYELIGGGGTLSQYSYQGPLGSTGIQLRILAGGPGDSDLGMPTVLYTGNPVLRVTPDLAMGSIDTALEDSAKFPVVAVDSFQEHDPLVLISDPAKFPNLDSIASLIAAAKAGAHFYVSSLQTIYVPYLISKGVPSSAFIGGYEGDLDKFVTGNGMIINQGYADSEVVNLEHFTPDWDKPVDYSFIYKLGLNDYDEVIELPKGKVASMTKCLTKLVPMLQQASVDYIEHPTVVNELLVRYNSGGYGASYWQTPMGYNVDADKALVADDIVGNSDGGAGPIGALNLTRLEGVVKTLLPIYGSEDITTYKPGVTAKDIATDKFIDPSIKLPAGG